jgi:hypothetical protein
MGWQIAFAILVGLGVTGIGAYEYLAYRTSKYHPAEWSKYYWFSGRYRFQNDLLFGRASWLKSDPSSATVYRLYRSGALVWCVLLVATLVVSLLLS